MLKSGRLKTVPPLTPASFHILLALLDGELHGYAIMMEVRKGTQGEYRLGPGTLYTSIHRMLGDGLIEEVELRRPARSENRRRYYRLTALGRRTVKHEVARLEKLLRLARTKELRGSPLGGGLQ
jgi:DNA-binding PadR family transcriptional regulator